MLLLALLASSQAEATQFVEGADRQHVQVTVSARETNRLAIEGRRISHVVPAQAGLVVARKDDAAGALYFTIAPDQPPNAAVTLFVTDEQHTTYKLILLPRGVPGDEIVLRPPGDRTSSPRAQPGARAASYQRQVKSLLLLMADDQGTAGNDAVTRIEVNREVPLSSETRLVLVARHVDALLVGERYLLTNLSAVPMQLAEPDLYRPSVRAVSIRQPSLAAGMSTDLYVVRERRDHE